MINNNRICIIISKGELIMLKCSEIKELKWEYVSILAY